jgi:hypothetical protein
VDLVFLDLRRAFAAERCGNTDTGATTVDKSRWAKPQSQRQRRSNHSAVAATRERRRRRRHHAVGNPPHQRRHADTIDTDESLPGLESTRLDDVVER